MKNSVNMVLLSSLVFLLNACGNASSPTDAKKSFQEYKQAQNNVTAYATSEAIFLHEDSQKDIALKGYSLEGDAISYRLLSSPAHGKLRGSAPDFTYIPDSNYFGSDSFTFVSHDKNGDSKVATISLLISNENDLPTTQKQNIVLKNDAVSILLLSEDIDSDKLTYSIEKEPLHGKLTGKAPMLMYTPDEDYEGVDSFTYITHDAYGDSTLGEITISIKRGNHPPVAIEQHRSFNEGTQSVTIQLQASDADIDVEKPTKEKLTFSITKEPKFGKLTLLNADKGSVKYEVNNNYFHGEDSFEFTVTDGKVLAQPAKVFLQIKGVNNKPFAFEQTLALAENNTTEFTLKGRDIDYDKLTYKIMQQPSHGTISGTSPTFTYAPDSDYYGEDSFTFVSDDGTVDSDLETVKINVLKNLHFKNISNIRGSVGDIVLSKDGTKAFVSGGYNSYKGGFKIIDISDETAPKIISTLAIEGHSYSLAISDDERIAYVHEAGVGFRIIDISDVTAPKVIATYETQEQLKKLVLSADGKTLYLGYNYGVNKIEIIDVEDSTNLTMIGKLDSHSYLADFVVSKDEKTLYLASTGNIQIVDISDKKAPKVLRDRYVGRTNKLKISQDGKTLYASAFVLTYLTHIFTFDISDPIILKGEKMTNFKSVQLKALSHDQQKLFLAKQKDIYVIDAKSHIVMGHYTATREVSSITLSQDDTRVYAGDYNDGFEVIELD